MFVTPLSDPKFAESRAHGYQAQLEFYREVKRFVKRFESAVDVGAHIGIWTRLLSRDFTHVYAFEPNPENFACLMENTESAGNVTRSFCALGSKPGMVAQMLPPQGNSGMWRISDGFDVEMRTLDEYAPDGVDLIKIDVEGYEGHVINGALATIRASKPIIVFEDNGTGQKYFGDAWVDPKPILKSLGYKVRLRWRKDEVWVPR